MRPVEAFKGLSNQLFVFGMQPLDLPVLVVLFVLLHGAFQALALDVLFVAAGIAAARRTRGRPADFPVRYYLYLATPTLLRVACEKERRVPWNA